MDNEQTEDFACGPTIQWNNHRQDTNTKTSDKAAAKDVIDIFRTGLNNHADSKYYGAWNSCLLTTKPICKNTVDKDANPGTKFQDTIDFC